MTDKRSNRYLHGSILSIFVLVSILSVLIFTGCKNDNQKEEKLMIGFSVCEDGSVRSVAVITSFLEEVRENDMTIEVRSANQSLKKQKEDIKYLIKQQPQYMVVIPIQSIGLGEVLKEAYESGIKVILLEESVNDLGTDEYISHITTDPEWEGKVCAQLLGTYFAGQGARILEVQGRKGSSITNARALGFREELSSYPNLEIVGVVDGQFDRIIAQKNIRKFIEKGETFDAVFGHSDEEGLGALGALSMVLDDISNIPIISINGQQDVKKALITGQYYACIETTPDIGSYIIEVIKKDIDGKDYEQKIVARGKIITQDNVSEMYGY